MSQDSEHNPNTTKTDQDGRAEPVSGDSLDDDLGLSEKDLAVEESNRHPWLVFFFRLISYGIIAAAVLFLTVWAAVALFLDDATLKELVTDIVQEQTGGKLEVEVLEFRFLTGLTAQNIRFYPPKLDDTRGFQNGGEVDATPLADINSLSFRYSIPMVFAGRLYLKSLQITSPQFHLRSHDGVMNFEPILAYRQEHFNKVDEAEVGQEADALGPEKSQTEEVVVSEDIVPVSPSLFFIPLDIMAKNVGIKDLRLDMIEFHKGQIAKLLMSSGLTLDSGFYLRGGESSVWFSAISPFEAPFELEIKQAPVKEGQVVGDLADVVTLKSAIIQRFEISDLTTIQVDFGMRLLNLTTAIASYEGLGAFMKTRLAFEEDYKKIVFEELSAEVADALRFALKGEVVINNDSFKSYDLGLEQSFRLDLQGLAELAKPLRSQLKASGVIAMDSLRIEGDVDLDELQKAMLPKQPEEKATPKVLKLPFVAGVVSYEEIQIEDSGLGFRLEPLSGVTTLSAGPSLTGQGSQVDLSSEVRFEAARIRQITDLGSIELAVEDLASKVTIRALWPEMIVPVLKVGVEAEHVLVSGDEVEDIDKPLYVDLDANLRRDMQRLGLTSSFELEDLIGFSALIDCQDACERFRANVTGRVDSLANVHAMILPLNALLQLGDKMPTSLKGSADWQLNARGRIPNPLKAEVEAILRDGKLRYNAQANLTNFTLAMPYMGVMLENFENRLSTSGSFAKQRLDISTGFSSLDANLPFGDQVQPLRLERLDVDVNVENSLGEFSGLSELKDALQTDITTNFYLGQTKAAGLLPQPINNLKTSVQLSQSQIKDIDLKKFEFEAPDFGLKAVAKIRAQLGEQFMPQSFNSDLTLKIDHSGSERLPGGVRSSGLMTSRLQVASRDMKMLLVDGLAAFDRFNLDVAKEEGFLLRVKEINGKVPFGQKIDLTPFLDKATTEDASVATQEADHEEETIAAIEPAEADFALAAGEFLARNENEFLDSTAIVSLVDYPTVRSFYRGKDPLSIKSIEAANLELSNMEFDIELKQNWFKVNQFVMEFLGGKIQGDFQLAFNPLPQKLKTSVHMTKLDTRQLIARFPNLKGKASSWDPFTNPYLGGTVHLQYDLVSNDMAGDIAITSIGKDQLKMMLYYVDPFDKDPTITSLKRYLNLGEVKQVAIPIKNGEVGMDVDVRVLAAPLPTPKLSRFPISQIIQNFRDEMTTKKEVEHEPKPLAPAGA